MAKEKKASYYSIKDYNSGLKNGSSIVVSKTMNYHGENANFKQFLSTPVKELEKQLKESMAEEKKVYDGLQKAIKAWEQHGAKSLLLQMAIEYLKVPEVKHTANEWKQGKDGVWEISNLVYKMTFSIVKFGDEWKLDWNLSYTAPGLTVGYWSYTRTPRNRIDHESSKKYKTMAGAQKYIQSKFDQYADHFETLSPPVPMSAKNLFCVNGQLLQGYSLARPEHEKEKVTLSDLLDCLDDDIISSTTEQTAPLTPPEQPPPPQPTPQEGRPTAGYKYYSTQRPVDIGTYPKPPDNLPVKITNYDKRIWLDRESLWAWGKLIYEKPLTVSQLHDYELKPSRDNPDQSISMEPEASEATEETPKTAGEKPPVPRPARPAPKKKTAAKKRSTPAR